MDVLDNAVFFGNMTHFVDESIVNLDCILLHNEKYKIIKEILPILSDRERDVVKLRLLGGRFLTMREVANVLGISQGRVGQIEAKAIKKIRKQLKRNSAYIDYFNDNLFGYNYAGHKYFGNIEMLSCDPHLITECKKAHHEIRMDPHYRDWNDEMYNHANWGTFVCEKCKYQYTSKIDESKYIKFSPWMDNARWRGKKERLYYKIIFDY